MLTHAILTPLGMRTGGSGTAVRGLDPEDPEAVKFLRKGDEALHDGDMDDAVKLCVQILPIGPVQSYIATVQGCGRNKSPVDMLTSG